MSDPNAEREAMTLFEEWLAIPEDERADWLKARTDGRPELLTRLQTLIDADTLGSIRTGGAMAVLEEEAIPTRIGAYRITGRIGRGGMGSIYRGERDAGDFQRTVAIKVIKPGLYSPELAARFQRERQTLALLNHPNIARLYDGGQTDDGSPYFVMELVDGLPLLQWAQERDLQRPARIALFRDICAAVAFAHSQLIVHRDLTPNNVMVTQQGVVKLIDFGIAKPADQHAPPAGASPSIGQLSLTPGYAAPERMTSALVTTAADIYSLGRLLQDLIPPEEKDDELRAIIARATADDPQARYPSADALLADVDAWRNLYPVAAVNGGPSYNLRKFVARRRAPVLAGAAVFVLLAGALALTLATNVRAEQARREAENRFQQTREIAKVMLFDVYDEVSQTAGSTSAREMLARAGLDYLDALAADESAPLDVRLEAGRGYLRLSQVTGGDQAGELARHQDGEALLARADEIIRPLYDRHPDNPEVARAMAQVVLDQAGANIYNNNKIGMALEQAQRAQAIIEPFSQQDADSARIYAVAIQAEGDTYGWNDDYPGSIPHFQRALAFLDALPEETRNEIALMRVRGALLRLLGEAYHNTDQPVLARETLDAAVTNNRNVMERTPNNPNSLRSYAIANWYRAVVHRTNDRVPEARVSIEEAHRTAQTMRARDPNDVGAVRLVAITGEVYAQVLGDLRRFPESYRLSDEVIAAHRQLVEQSSGSQGARRSLAAALATTGGNYYNGGQYARACQFWRETHEIYSSFERAGTISEYDRTHGLAEMREFLRDACNPPRAGLRESP
ncbi:MAG TPA: serine/threonine-protein kinase, partial [Terricaulis sp.]|nr:serine/threonine-protein kinase [Terricaulis sp.]